MVLKKEMNAKRIQDWFSENPDFAKLIMQKNSSYIFFKISEKSPKSTTLALHTGVLPGTDFYTPPQQSLVFLFILFLLKCNLFMKLSIKLRSYYYQLRYGISNLIKWFPIVWRDRDFDSAYIMEILLFKMREFLWTDGLTAA